MKKNASMLYACKYLSKKTKFLIIIQGMSFLSAICYTICTNFQLIETDIWLRERLWAVPFFILAPVLYFCWRFEEKKEVSLQKQ